MRIALDVPRDRFLVAGAAWKACRAGGADLEKFLVDPDLEVEVTRGWPYLRHNLIHDLAALNKKEMILWDTWGLMEQEQSSEEDLALLDGLSQTTLSTNLSLTAVRNLYEKETKLQVPKSVTSYSPTSESPLEVVFET